MSVARKVAFKVNIDRLMEVAREQKYIAVRNTTARGWLGTPLSNGKQFPLVIRGSRFDIGVDENSIEADFHGGEVQGMMSRLWPAYISASIEGTGYEVEGPVIVTKDEIVLRVRA